MRISAMLANGLLVALLAALPTHHARAEDRSVSTSVAEAGTRLRAYKNAYLATARGRTPAWARKYNMNCSGCHYPAPPRLNGTGLRFRWAGYRMPEEIGESVDVTRIENYAAAGGEFEFEFGKTEGEASEVTLAAPDIEVFYGGPFGRNYSGFVELGFESEGGIERVFQLTSLWGTEAAFGGLRVGRVHVLPGLGVAGFDALPALSTPTPLDAPVTAAIPFRFAGDQLAVEAYFVRGPNRFSAQILNGVNTEGEGEAADVDRRKDFLLTDQVLLDDAGSGIQAVGYLGSLAGLDALAPEVRSRFWRFAVSANKIFHNFEALGGLVYGRDLDLPATFPTERNTGIGYWFSGQYFVTGWSLTLFGRYEFVDPDTDTDADGNRRFVFGSVLPVNLPEYLRGAVEYRLDSPQGGLPKTSNLAVALLLTF